MATKGGTGERCRDHFDEIDSHVKSGIRRGNSQKTWAGGA
jgi:hypothetical protein